MEWHSYPNRLVCSVLEEMRNSLKCLTWPDDQEGHATFKRFHNHMAMLIEEAQTYVNRMETALEDQDDVRRAHKKVKKLKKEIKELEKKKGGEQE